MIKRVHITIRGAVQGVGFRPFIFRLADELHLKGWVLNSSHGVYIEVEGEQNILDNFILRIKKEKPPLSYIQSLESRYLDPIGYNTFEIRKSIKEETKSAIILPDIATCPECLKEIFDPSNRRYLYPFTNCTNCGPRYSIIESLPYDRPNTTMKSFIMCNECLQEYENPLNRRFHAQPNGCPRCGPHVYLSDENGNTLAVNHQAILQLVEAIREGKIAAVKGLGGFHLMVDARNDKAVIRLRERKHREEKPFAILFPSVKSIRQVCLVSNLEENILLSPESPIVLLQKINREKNKTLYISDSIAPDNPYLGAMLPYTPLHHIIMRELNFPVVATSGNLSDEPICIDNDEALKKLGNIADIFLFHNRQIKRHVDDSIVRVIMGRELILRRARGYAPLPLEFNGKKNIENDHHCIIAVGAHLKNAIAVASGKDVFLSQHIGDLDTRESFLAFENAIKSLSDLYNLKPSIIVSDMHPDYISTTYAVNRKEPKYQVQHHYAHVRSCMLENHLDGDVLGIAWDGTGFGTNATIWGGEFLKVDERSFERVATFKQFRLPGGDKAIKEPRRTAIGVLYEIFKDDILKQSDLPPFSSFSKSELKILISMIKKGINSPLTSSAGRLFDAIASIIGVRHITNYEGQSAMMIEFICKPDTGEDKYPYKIDREVNPMIVDWIPMFREIVNDYKINVPNEVISGKFHNTLSSIIIDICGIIGKNKIVLSGGCFQNKYLTERTINLLINNGFQPYWHQRVPPNDGGIALGQVAAVWSDF